MLVDTGASDSSIAGRIAERLGLPVLGYHRVAGFGATRDAHQFLADVDLILDEVSPIRDLGLLRFDQEADNFQGILGRDVLIQGTLFLDGPNRRFTLSF